MLVGDFVDEWDEEVESCAEGFVVFTESFDDEGFTLRYDACCLYDCDDEEDGDHDGDDLSCANDG